MWRKESGEDRGGEGTAEGTGGVGRLKSVVHHHLLLLLLLQEHQQRPPLLPRLLLEACVSTTPSLTAPGSLFHQRFSTLFTHTPPISLRVLSVQKMGFSHQDKISAVGILEGDLSSADPSLPDNLLQVSSPYLSSSITSRHLIRSPRAGLTLVQTLNSP